MGNVKFGDLKKAIQALNEMDHIEENIRYVGVKKDVLVELFCIGTDACPEEEDFPESVVSMYDLVDGDLRKVIRILNKMNYIKQDKKLKIECADLDRDGLTKIFLDAVDICPEEDKGNLSEEVVSMYNELAEDDDSDTGKDESETGEKGKDEECPDFGKGHGKDKDKCGECKETFPEDYDECKKLSKPKAKTVAKKKTGKAKTKKVEKEKKDQEPKYTRRDAFLDAFKKGGTKAKLIEMSNELYEKSGGKANVRVASNQVDRYLPAFDVLGILNKKGEGSDTVYSWKKK